MYIFIKKSQNIININIDIFDSLNALESPHNL